MLILPHESSALQNSTTQTADGDFIVRVPGSTSSTFLRSWVVTPRAHYRLTLALTLSSSELFVQASDSVWVWYLLCLMTNLCWCSQQMLFVFIELVMWFDIVWGIFVLLICLFVQWMKCLLWEKHFIGEFSIDFVYHLDSWNSLVFFCPLPELKLSS